MKAYLLAAASSVLYVVSYPGFDVWPLAFVALVPVLVALAQLPAGAARRALGVGLTFGSLVQLAGYSFLIETLREFSGLPLPICLAVYALLCVAQGGQLALFCVLTSFLRGERVRLAYAPFAYAAAELVYPQLFPTPLAASLHPVPVLLQPLELFGPTGLSLLVAFVNAALAELVLARLERRRPPWRLAAGAALALALAFVYGSVRMPEEQARSARAPKLIVGVVQADLGIWQKRRDPQEGRRRHIEQSLKLERAARPDLIVWPETALVDPVPATARSLAAELAPLRTPALVGAVAYAPQPKGRALLYNSAFLAGARGEVLGRSDKVRLIPFAEYIPLGERFPQLYELSRGSGQLSAAGAPRALELGGRRIAVLICYEDVLPGFVRNAVRSTGAELLVDISNDAWFGHSREPAIHLALSTLRAVEQRRYLVRASNSGPSAVIDPLGRVVRETPAFERAEFAAEVAWRSGQTPYARLGDIPGLAALGVCGFILLRRRRRAGPSAARPA